LTLFARALIGRALSARVAGVITLDEVPASLDLVRKSDGPPRIVVHPNGDIA
jgi:ABC-type molybdate transport system ATPase subunit